MAALIVTKNKWIHATEVRIIFLLWPDHRFSDLFSSTIHASKASLTDSKDDVVLSISADGTTVHKLVS